MKVLSIWVGTNTDDIAEEISDSLEHDEILDFIYLLDKKVADWDFTKKLTERFTELMKHYGE